MQNKEHNDNSTPNDKDQEEPRPSSSVTPSFSSADTGERFCWNCGKKIDNPTVKQCTNCKAPLREQDKQKILSRTSPSESVKCWFCDGTTSGDFCGICGAPLTRSALKQSKETASKKSAEVDYLASIAPERAPAMKVDFKKAIVVQSPKDKEAKRIDIPLDELKAMVSKYVNIMDTQISPQIGPQFIVEAPESSKKVFEDLTDDPLLQKNNLKVLIRDEQIGPGAEAIVLRFFHWESMPPKERYSLGNIKWNIILFIATIATVGLAGWNFTRETYAAYEIQGGNMALDIFLFTISLLGIITIHELGHFAISRWRDVDVTLPYFIPVPSIPGVFPSLGTFGALIRQKEPIQNRNALFDIGISGPVAGFVIAVPVYFIGLAQTFVVNKPADYEPPDLTNMPTVLLDSLFQQIGFATGLIPTYDPDTQLLIQHPMMFAGWIGFILTGLNLMPASQLDGGHTSRAVFGGKVHRILSLITGILLAINPSTLVFGLLILFMSMFQQHPGPLNDVTPVHWSKKVIVVVGFLVAITCIPLPINLLLSLFGGG
ncbi:MAG: hypothetical protein GF308_14985 [Candidatus Heimdallarchaeota archaeon]|nr:hypothetical protein [Candidatus Heimdallarchaeota archaeon]